MRASRYERYKPSGVDWLGEVPAHWSVLPLCRVASRPGSLFIDGDWIESKDLSDDGVRYLTTGNVGEGSYKEQGLGFISEATFNELQCTEVRPGDVLVSRLNQPIGRACLAPDLGGRLVTSVDNVIVRPDADFDPRYLIFMLSSKAHFANMDGLARGTTMQRISRSVLGRVRFALPPVAEQRQIASFLIQEARKIDALVEEQRRLIELLKEKRQAVITRAVTKGIDPNVGMKDSGVEWLGKVPAHWELKRIKHLVNSFEQGWSPQCEGRAVDSDQEWGVLKVGCVNGGVFRPEENKVLPPDLEPQPALGMAADDLLISRANTRELVGNAAVVDRNYPNLMLCDKLYRLRLKRAACTPRFLRHYLATSGVRGQIELQATGASSSMVNIGQSTILELSIALPDLVEQMAITAEIQRACNQIDALTTDAQAAIALLLERRSALISAAVTGKVDVRGLVPQPEEAVA